HRAPARSHHAAPGRPARPALARRHPACEQPAGDLQPRRDVLRGGLLGAADADRRVQRRRRDAYSRGGSRDLPQGALLPGLLERDVRQGARGAPDRADPVLPAPALRRRQGLRALRDAQDHLGCRGDQAGTRDRAAPREPRGRARLGLREGLRGGDVVDAPARRARGLRDRHGRHAFGARLRRGRLRPGGARAGRARRARSAVRAPGGSRPPDRRPHEGHGVARLDAEDRLRDDDPPDGRRGYRTALALVRRRSRAAQAARRSIGNRSLHHRAPRGARLVGMTTSTTIDQIVELLGEDAASLLDHTSTTIERSLLHLPGPDFVDRIYADTDRNNTTLRNLAALFGHGRLAGTGYVSILPVDQGIEHSAGASFAPNPIYFDPGAIVELAIEGGCNAVASTLGVLGAVSRRYAHHIPFIVKLNHNELLTSPNRYDQVQFASVQRAWELGAAAVGATIYFGSEESTRQIVEIAHAFEEAHSLGMFTV